MRDLLSQLSELPPHTIVLYSTVFKDGEGTPFVPHDVAERLAAASNAPVYGFLDQYLGRGIVGGRMYSLDAQGEAAANLVLKVLAGMPPSNIPVVEPEASVTRFDWRQLQRWGIRENQLPQGSAVLFRQLSFWDQYKLYVIEGAAIVALQSVIIGGLLLQRKRRRRAEASLRESERRFRLVANTAPVLIWMSGPDKLCNYFNQPWLDFTGRPLEAELGNGRSEGVHPEDLKNCLDIYTRAFDLRESFKMQYRLRRHDGEYRWLLDIGVPRLNPNGAFAGYIGSCIDVTDRKLAEEALAGVGRRLIEAHEEERTWLARELHDDINQRIALLAVQLEQWAQNAPYSVVEVTDHIRHVRQDLSDLGKDVQALSHRLHSSKLEYLGIAAAASGFCKELSEQQKIEIDFSHAGVPLSLPKEISLCLFRVLQEALQNAIKHSGERHFKVELRGTSSEIQLTVSDSGVGFDQQDSIDRRGIGLVSMRERLNLVGGEFSIESKHGSGTTIRAQVPYMAELRRASTVG
jgi:PAS domain S-box-containing protein